ncbi:hypothetical protein QFZ97_004169 [Paraburkholderia youngii]
MDKAGNTIDFLFGAKRDKTAARRFFEKAIDQNGSPETVTIDKSGSNLAALHAVNAKRETPIKISQVKYLNNVVSQTTRSVDDRCTPQSGRRGVTRLKVRIGSNSATPSDSTRPGPVHRNAHPDRRQSEGASCTIRPSDCIEE